MSHLITSIMMAVSRTDAAPAAAAAAAVEVTYLLIMSQQRPAASFAL